MHVVVEENYKGYVPPPGLTLRVEKAITYVPPQYLTGLSHVTLTNADALPRAKRRRKHRGGRSANEVRGYYAQPKNGGPPYIVIFVEHVFPSNAKPNRMQYESHMLNLVHVLYHEIGHHVHLTKKREYGGKERIADDYAFEFQKRYLCRRGPILLVLAVVHLPTTIKAIRKVVGIFLDARRERPRQK